MDKFTQKNQLHLLLLLLLLTLSSGTEENENGMDEQSLESAIIKHLEESKYQPTVRPPSMINSSRSKHQPVKIWVGMYIVTISSISVANNEFTMDIILRQQWTDKRLALNHTFGTLSIGYLKSKLWTPDLYFRNSKSAFSHKVTKPNYMIWLYPNGLIKFSQKLTVTSFCDMNLWNFPLDTQTCYMEMSSYGYPLEDLQFDWWETASNGTAISMKTPLSLNEFEQPSISSNFCVVSFDITGNFSCLMAEFELKRKFGFYLIYTYMPSIFIVSISWVSFFIDHRAVPARITLGLLALLALMTQSSSVVEKLPRVSYIKAIDIWMFTCLAFVIMSLFEFTVVNCLSRAQDKNKLRNELRQVVKNELLIMGSTACRPKNASSNNTSTTEDTTNMQCNSNYSLRHILELDENPNENVSSKSRKNKSNPNHNNKDTNSKSHLSYLLKDTTKSEAQQSKRLALVKARKIDQHFRVWFPVAFIIFNIVYWFTFNRS